MRPSVPPPSLSTASGAALGIGLPTSSSFACGGLLTTGIPIGHVAAGSAIDVPIPVTPGESAGSAIGATIPVAPGLAGGGVGSDLPVNNVATTISQAGRQLAAGRAYTQAAASPRRFTVSATLDLTQSLAFGILLLAAGSGDAVITGVDLECTAAAGVTTDATASVGIEQDNTAAVADTPLTGFSSAGKVFSLVAQGRTKRIAAGEVLVLVVSRGAVATTLSAVANVIGFYV